jgi:2-polyprenyl-6-methoxyphenol hydroxylase-like FAD-dependent oxidoreductase
MKITVVGAGIGGHTAAIALRRTGPEVEVLERDPEPREIGAGLSLAPNAMRTLDELGVPAREHSADSEVTGTLRLASGRYLRRFRAGRDRSVAAFHRSELHRVLLNRLPESCVHGGREITSVSEVDAELIVAADGVHSRLRKEVSPAEPHFRYTAWRGVTESAPNSRGSFTNGRGGYFMIHPLSGGRACWAFGAAAKTPGVRYPDEHAEVTRRIEGWHAEARELVAGTEPETVLHNDIIDLDPLPSFVGERVALLGDAAHAVVPDLGQGACQAIEDAAVLAAALRDEADVPAALAAYDRSRRPRAAYITRTARSKGAVNTSTAWWLQPLLALSIPLLPTAAIRKQTAPIWDWQPPSF